MEADEQAMGAVSTEGATITEENESADDIDGIDDIITDEEEDVPKTK
jgi:hypothetical protein